MSSIKKAVLIFVIVIIALLITVVNNWNSVYLCRFFNKLNLFVIERTQLFISIYPTILRKYFSKPLKSRRIN